MAKKKLKKAAPKHLIDSAYVTFRKLEKVEVTLKGKKEEKDRLTVGLSFKEVPATIKKAFAKGKRGSDKIRELLKADPEYGSRSLFASAITDWVKGDIDVDKGDKVMAEVSTNVVDGRDGGDMVFFNLKNIELLDEVDEDNWEDDGENDSSSDSSSGEEHF